jgi:hypothetical protein
LSPTLVITPGGGGSPCTFPLPTQATLTTDTIDVTSCLNTTAKLNGAQIQYQVHLTGNGSTQSATASADGLQIAATATDTAARSITLTGFATSLGANATLASVTLDVAHGESAGTNPAVVVTRGGGGGTCPAIALPQHDVLATDTITVPASCLATGAQLNNATVAFQVNVAGGPVSATATFDGAALNTTYYERPSFPNACDPDQPGVQFIFGGDSHVYMPDGTAELCAGPSPGNPGQPGYTAQQIALYGIPPTPDMVPTQVISNPGGFSPANDGLANGDYLSDGRVRTANTTLFFQTKSITVGGFNPTVIPPGMAVDSVVARVSHARDAFRRARPRRTPRQRCWDRSTSTASSSS